MRFLQNSVNKWLKFTTFLIVGFLVCLLGLIAYLLWQPSVLILFLGFFFLDIPKFWKKIGLVVGVIVFVWLQWSYLLHSFALPENWVSEEIPLIGLIFILHILHTYKYIPSDFKWYGIFLIVLGALKSKFMFLATPLILIGLLDKQLKTGLKLKREVFGIKEIPVLYVCGILLFGFVLMGISMYPTQSDLNEMKQAIQLSKDNNQFLYNDWGDGWMLVSLGYETEYKAGARNPDWNKLTRPYLAWSIEEIVGCERISKKTQQCN